MGFLRETADIESKITKSPSTTAFAVLAATLALSAMLNVVLARRIQNFTNAQRMKSRDQLLNVGATAPSITAKRLGGQKESISYQGVTQATVLYVFTPSCVWCARNLENLKTLADKDGDQYRFIALSLSEEGLAEYVDKNGFKFPVYSDLSKETKAAYKLSGTPQTIVISPEGRVLENWIGAYVGGQKSQVEAFFHVTLPGLREAPKAEEAALAR